MIDRLLIFDLKGKIAHFRKFYTSSSSLSYTFPSRTTITGLVAAILGREKDTYYEEFSSQNCKIGISIKTPIRKIMQTVNYIRTKKGAKKGEESFASTTKAIESFIERRIIKYPTPLELVIPTDLTEEITYRVYFWHRSEQLMEELGVRLKKQKFVYPLYLGISEFLANAEFVDDIFSSNIRERTIKEAVKITTVCKAEDIEELEFDNMDTETLQYVSERMPLEFEPGREIKRKADFIHEKNQNIIKAKLKIPYIEINYVYKKEHVKENILFME